METGIELNADEAMVFLFAVDGELKDLVNEWDPDTGRIPGKQRLAKRPLLEKIMGKWITAQGLPSDAAFIPYNKVGPCLLSFSKREVREIKSLTKKMVRKDGEYITSNSCPEMTRCLKLRQKAAESFLQKLPV